ncbi:MAG: NADase-type glycan-binding domain-containing protein [Bilifractor sp.]|jgi:cytoskeletal protein RodZ
MRCPYCGQDNPSNAQKCIRCGRRLDKIREKRKEKSILVVGILFVVVILAAGVGAMYGVSNLLSNTVSNDNEPQKVTIISTPKPTEEAVASSSSSSSSAEAEQVQPITATSVSTPTPAPVTASLTDEDALQKLVDDGYSQVKVASSEATSTIQQENVDNDPHVLYDGADWSSWQEGVDGPGLGESVTLTFDQTYKVRAMALKLGNWYSDISYYTRNNRPSQLTFKLGSQEVTVDFPDEKQVMYVEFSEDVDTNFLQTIIDEVYSGTMYDDTCICEITIYGKAADGSTGDTTVVTTAPTSTPQPVQTWDTTQTQDTTDTGAGTADTGTTGDTGAADTTGTGDNTGAADTTGTDTAGTTQ